MYSNTRYNRRSPNIITPPKAIKKIQPVVAQIESIKEIPKIYGHTSLTDRQNMYKRARQDKQTQTFLANYNDPTELNSYIDALTNREAVSKKFGETWGTISTTSGVVSVIAAVVEAAAWVASLLLPDASAIGAAGSGAAAGMRATAAGTKAAQIAAATAKAAQVAKAAKTTARVAKTVKRVAALPALPAAAHVTVEKGIKPIIAGKPKEALLNMLMNLGETMDYAANPVKGLFLEGIDGFIKGTGLSDEGRVNYDYDTGFFLTDMLLEVLTDPINLVQSVSSLASLRAIKHTAKNTAKAINKNLKSVLKEATPELEKRINKHLTVAIQDVTKTWTQASLKNASKEQLQNLIKNGREQIQRAWINAVQIEVPNITGSQLEIIMKQVNRASETGKFTNSIFTQINNITFDELSTTTIRALSGITTSLDSFDNAMMKGALFTSGYGAGIQVLRAHKNQIISWANNKVLSLARRFKGIIKEHTLDIKNWQRTKEIWNTSHKYTTLLTGERVPLNEHALYEKITEQLNADKTLIQQITVDKVPTAEKISMLNNAFKQKYGVESFAEYIQVLKDMNVTDNGRFTEFFRYADSQRQVLLKQEMLVPIAGEPKTSTQVLKAQTLESVKKAQIKATNEFADAIKITGDKVKTTDQFYTVKLNDARENIYLLNNPKITSTLDLINSNVGVGAAINKMYKDSQTLLPEISAEISDALDTVVQASKAMPAMQSLYDDLAKIYVPETVAEVFKEKDLIYYLFDQIIGLRTRSVTELLAGFDSITMPTLLHNLDMFLDDFTFSIKQSPELCTQLSIALRNYLETLHSAGIDRIDSAIVQNYTHSIDLLLKHFENKFPQELTELAAANQAIKIEMALIRDQNAEILQELISDKNTIFSIFDVKNTRELSDLGLALKTIARKEDLKLFDFGTDLVEPAVFASAEQLSKSIKRLVNGFEQYRVFFSQRTIRSINKVYTRFLQEFADTFSELEYPAFQYLKHTNNVYEQFAIFSIFNKMSKDIAVTKRFKLFLSEEFSSNLYRKIINPDSLLVTDFAPDAMQESAWITNKRSKLYNDTINVVTAYDNLSNVPKKITQDFLDIQNYLSKNKFDRPIMMQYKRYVELVRPVNDFLSFFEQHVNSRFNKTLATEKINQLREVLVRFPTLYNKYANLVDTLEAYWRGEKLFKQSKKADAQLYTRTRYELQNKVKRRIISIEEMQAELQRLEAIGIIDEFTIFWEDLKEMELTINDYVTQYNKDVVNRIISETAQIPHIHVTPWDPVREQQQLNKLVNKASKLNAQGAITRFINLDATQTAQELAFRKGITTFHDSDIVNRHMFNKFIKQLGNDVIYEYTPKTGLHWLAIDTKRLDINGRQVSLDGNPLIRNQFPVTFDEFKVVDDFINDPNNPGVTKTLNNFSQTMYDLTGSYIGDSQGEFFSEGMFKEIYKQMPTKIQEAMHGLITKQGKLTKQGKAFFNAYSFNESVLGQQARETLGLFSSNMITNMSNSVSQALNYIKPRTEYVHTVFDSALQISSPNSIFKNYTNKQLLDALQISEDHVLAALVEDTKYVCKVREILPLNEKSIDLAKELGAVIIPRQVYYDMYNTINKRLGAEGLAKLWSRIMYVYKSGYLMRPGAWARNFIDTSLKTMLELKGNTGNYNKKAIKILHDVNRLKKHIRQATKSFQDITLRKRKSIAQITEEWFANGNSKYLTLEQFKELDADFLSQGIAGSVTRMLDPNPEGDLYKIYTEVSGWIVETGNKFEEVNRLATYLYELDKGLSKTSALSKVRKIHFDYSFKSTTEQLIEMVFPFTTFMFRNFSYWMDAVDKNPWLLRNYVHAMKPHWDFKDYTPEELARDYAIQTQILYGQLKLGEFNNKVITFKANPSIQSALTMFADPINSVYENLAAPINVPIALLKKDYVQPESIIPVLGAAIQSVKSMIKTGSPLPSAIGVSKVPKRTGQKSTKQSVKFKNKNLSKVNKFRDKYYYRPRYTKNVIYDSYSLKGINRYRVNLYPIIDIAHDVRSRYSVNVYNRIKNRVRTDVYQGIRYRLRLDANRFR